VLNWRVNNWDYYSLSWGLELVFGARSGLLKTELGLGFKVFKIRFDLRLWGQMSAVVMFGGGRCPGCRMSCVFARRDRRGDLIKTVVTAR